MKRVVFVLGTYEREAIRQHGTAMTDATFRIFEEACDNIGCEGEFVYVVPDAGYAGTKANEIKMVTMRHHRERVVQQIRDLRPDLVLGCGPLPLAFLLNKKKALENHLRTRIEAPGLEGLTVGATRSVEQFYAKPGSAIWLTIDAMAIMAGFTAPKWGKYTVLLPGKPGWATRPTELAGARLIGFDLETYPGLDPWHPDARIRMAVISDKAGRAWVVQARRDSTLPRWVTQLARDPMAVCAGSNIKYDYRWMQRFGYTVTNMHDTSTAEHIIDCTQPFTNLKALTFIYLPRLADYERGCMEMRIARGGKDRWDLLEDHEMYQYCGGDGEASIAAAKGQRRLLKNKGLLRPFRLSMELYEVLAKMETAGACVDPVVNAELDREFDKGLGDLRAVITEELGPINLDSPAQLAAALKDAYPKINLSKPRMIRQFSDIQWDMKSDKKDNDVSTDKAVLEREASRYPIIEQILLYRRYAKLSGTYVVGLRDKHMVTHTDGQCYVHTSYRSDVVETFRLSSQGPNVQNVPRKPEPDDPHPIPIHLNIKRQYVSRFPGGRIIDADLSQAEIRLAAHLSQDKQMLEAIWHGTDIHAAMCSRFMGMAEADVTKLERTTGKRTNFLVIYGGGAKTLGLQLGIPKYKAAELLALYFGTFSGLAEYMYQCGVDVMATLESESIFGYKRRFRAPDSWDSWPGWRTQRQAWNHRVQNSAVCCNYIAMIDAQAAMEKLKMQSQIVIQVHDNLVVDTHPNEVDEVAHLVKHHMENPDLARYGVELTVPLLAEVSIGPNWGEVEEYITP